MEAMRERRRGNWRRGEKTWSGERHWIKDEKLKWVHKEKKTRSRGERRRKICTGKRQKQRREGEEDRCIFWLCLEGRVNEYLSSNLNCFCPTHIHSHILYWSTDLFRVFPKKPLVLNWMCGNSKSILVLCQLQRFSGRVLITLHGCFSVPFPCCCYCLCSYAPFYSYNSKFMRAYIH